jgi:hypothetical protein
VLEVLGSDDNSQFLQYVGLVSVDNHEYNVLILRNMSPNYIFVSIILLQYSLEQISI